MELRMFLFGNVMAVRSHLRWSTTSSASASIKFLSTTTQKPRFSLVVDYLTNSLGFSKESAISVSSKFKVTTHLKSFHNFDSVVNLLKTYGFDNTQIKHIVSSSPLVLRLDANKTLEPKLRVLDELGMSRSDLVMHVTKNPYVLRVGLNTGIIPIVDYLRVFLGSDEKVIKAISKSKWFLPPLDLIKRNVDSLHNCGLSDEQIRKIFVFKPNLLKFKPEWLESRLHYLEGKWGISRDSTTLIYGLDVVVWSAESIIEKKIDVFRGFGWSDLEVYTLLRAFPMCLSFSEDRIRDKLDFFMKELGYTPAYLTQCRPLLSLSLEKRVKPRNEVLKVLEEKKLVMPRKPSLCTLAKFPEPKFLKFVQSFKNEIPNLYEIYCSSIK